MQHYTYIKHATPSEKIAMREIVDSANELAGENWEIHGYALHYTLEKIKSGYGMVATIAKSETDFVVGNRFDSASFVRCSWCGGIRELFDGQGEFCLECNADWEKPIEQMHARNLWDECQMGWTFMNAHQATIFRNKIKRLAGKVDAKNEMYTFAVQYLDSLALRTDMTLNFA